MKAGKAYKAYVEAYKLVGGQPMVIGRSLLLHSITGNYNKRYANVKKIKGTVNHVTVAAGSSYQLSGYKLVLYKKKRKALESGHGPKFRYITTDDNIASVTDTGLITGKNPGNCYIVILAINGVRKTVSVTVQ